MIHANYDLHMKHQTASDPIVKKINEFFVYHFSIDMHLYSYVFDMKNDISDLFAMSYILLET